ncbi:MAG: GatB/YqeY domain-containing protein [Calditrichaeota bacterium]|nr:MAG: GatB/YqeY domain-containing protein [Calditrichota bacterium]
MNLAEKLMHDMKEAMKSGEKQKLNTIRQIRAQIKNEQIESGDELDDAGVLKVLNNAAKKRKDAMEMYKKGEREDLFAVEEAELAIIQAYLPKQLSEAEVEAIVVEVIDEVGAHGAADFGKVMKGVMAKTKGLADGKVIQQIVRAKLG